MYSNNFLIIINMLLLNSAYGVFKIDEVREKYYIIKLRLIFLLHLR